MSVLYVYCIRSPPASPPLPPPPPSTKLFRIAQLTFFVMGTESTIGTHPSDFAGFECWSVTSAPSIASGACMGNFEAVSPLTTAVGLSTDVEELLVTHLIIWHRPLREKTPEAVVSIPELHDLWMVRGFCSSFPLASLRLFVSFLCQLVNLVFSPAVASH